MRDKLSYRTMDENSRSGRLGGNATATAPPQPSKSAGSGSHPTLMVVFFSLLIDLLGFTVILPLIPSMLEHYSKTDQVDQR